MKKHILVIVSLVMLTYCCFAAAETVPEEYPAIIEGLDFGGATVYINDWYSTGERAQEPTEEQQAQYDYWDWLEATYNVHFVEVKSADWDGMVSELQNIVTNQDNNELRIVGVYGGFVGAALKNNLFMPWTYGLENFSQATEDFMTLNGVCYGASGGKYNEPRICVFFNKRVLEDAGINWNDIYDAQANGTWTWEKMESYMDTVKADKDNDGELDVYALTGNFDDGVLGLVVSNNGDFFDFDGNGKLHYSADSENTLAALNRIQQWNRKYYRPYVNWDDYKQFWPEGNVAFLIGQSYEGFNGNDVVNIVEEWGCVCLPKGPAADAYTSNVDNNVYGIPAVYDDETALKLQQIYTLYRMNPVYDAYGDDWATRLYGLTDERAVDETYAYLREHGTVMNFNYIGDRNSTIGPYLTWSIMAGNAAELVEEARAKMEELAAEFNNEPADIVLTAEKRFDICQAWYTESFTPISANRYFIMPVDSEATLNFSGIYGNQNYEVGLESQGDCIQIADRTINAVSTGTGTISVWIIRDGEEVAKTRSTANVLVIDPQKTLQLPGKITWIESEAFMRTNAECIVIPGSIWAIESRAFSSNPNLKVVILTGDPSGVRMLSPFTQTQSVLFLSGTGEMPQGLNAVNTGLTGFTGF